MLVKPSLMIRLPNWVGDVMMTLPSLRALHSLGLTLHLLGKPWIFDVLNKDQFHLYEYPSNDFRKTIKVLRQIPSDHLLLFTNSFGSAFSGKCAGKKIIGFKTDGRNFLLQHGLKKINGFHEVNYFWELSRFAIQSLCPELKWPTPIPTTLNLPLLPIHEAQAKSKLQTSNIQGKYWVICPLATGKGKKGQSKIWPYWNDFYRVLKQKNITVVACPGPGEEAKLQELIPNITTLTNVSLGEYATILKNSEKVIANDSGPMHLAAAVGADVLGIFGTTDPNDTYPWGGKWIGSKNKWPTLDEVIKQIFI